MGGRFPWSIVYLENYYRGDKDTHDVDKGQARADNAIAEKLYRKIIRVDVDVSAVVIRVRFSLHMRHFNRSVYQPYTSKSPKQALIK